MVRRYLSSAAVLLLSLAANAAAFDINLSYPSGTLFSSTHDAAAKAAINAAAADLSAAITTHLSAINTDVYTGTSGAATASFDWQYQYADPTTGAEKIINTATIPANTVTMYVGADELFGNTLGEGGPAGTGFEVSFSYNPSNPGQLVPATANAASQSQLAYKRGGGPVIRTLAGSTTVAGVPISYTVQSGVAYGRLSLDWDGNNNGSKDSDVQLSNYWHFDHTTPVAAGKNDLYSVALHEMLHAVGFGASDSWDARVAGTTWTGPSVATLMGSGSGLIAPSQDHIAAGIMSTRAWDGILQEAAMTPSIPKGTRKNLTALDLAMLRDIGYSTVNWVTAPTSPADFDNDGDVDGADLIVWRGAYGKTSAADADSDNDSDGRDFLIWQRQYTGPSPLAASTTVPEPSTALLIATAMLLLGQRQRCRSR